jgi:hypothetical protein
MNRPRVTSIASAALSSAAAFFVLTRSGLAGTLAGAAVASMVYTSTSHWGGQGLERIARWWIVRRGGVVATPPVAEPGAAPVVEPVIGSGAGSAEDVVAETALGPAGLRPWKPARLARRYGPVALAVAALAVSGYSLATGSPLERVIIHERIVEKPVVQERVVVQKETVTVTVPVTGEQPTTITAAPSSSSTTTSTAAPTTTTTTVPPTTTTTTGVSATTTVTATSATGT